MSLLSTYTDETLVQLLAGTEPEKAFEELYNRYWEKLLIQAIIKLKSEADAEEVVQQVFINLWRRRSSLTLKYSFYTFIAAAVKFEILNLLAKQQRLRVLHNAISDAAKETQQEINVEESVIDYRMSLLEQELEKLPQRTKLIFSLSKRDEMSGKEIAEKLQISPKTVEAHITKALKHLRTVFGRFLFFLY